MSIILTNKSNFIPAPEGVHDAVCVDVVDLGMVKVTWKGKTKESHKVRIAWELDKEMPPNEDGEKKGRFIAMNRYTLSMDAKSNLRKMLKTWRGRDFTKEEMDGFDLEKIIGIPCQILITHNDDNKDGVVYANVESVLKAGDKKLSASGKYKRVKDREGYEGPNSPTPKDEGVQDDDDSDSIPF